MNFSIVTIARNEEEVIDRFFQSIRRAFPQDVEVILVDTGSSDKTVEKARAHGAVVYTVGERFVSKIDVLSAIYINQQVGNTIVQVDDRLFAFDEARNHSHSLSSKEWCLSMDLSQIIEYVDLSELQKEIDSKKANSFMVDIYIEDRKFSSLRLYSKQHNKWDYSIHENITPKNCEILNCLKIRHIRKDEKLKNYLPMTAYSYFFTKKDARSLFYFARDLFNQKFYIEARKYLILCMNRVDGWSKERSMAACLWAETFENFSEKINGYTRAYNIFPGWRTPIINLALLELSQNNPLAAVGYAERALEIPKQEGKSYFSEKLSFYSTEPYRIRYEALLSLAINCYLAESDPTRYLEKYLLVEEKTGKTNKELLTGWDFAYKIFLNKDKKRAKFYFEKCLQIDPSTYESAKNIFG